jgi:hypothetical protein
MGVSQSSMKVLKILSISLTYVWIFLFFVFYPHTEKPFRDFGLIILLLGYCSVALPFGYSCWKNPSLNRLFKIVLILINNLPGEFNFEVQESGEGELGACESTDLGRKLSSDETIQTPNS